MLLPSMSKGGVDSIVRKYVPTLTLIHLCQRYGTDYARCQAETINIIPQGSPIKTVQHQIHTLLQKFPRNNSSRLVPMIAILLNSRELNQPLKQFIWIDAN